MLHVLESGYQDGFPFSLTREEQLFVLMRCADEPSQVALFVDVGVNAWVDTGNHFRMTEESQGLFNLMLPKATYQFRAEYPENAMDVYDPSTDEWEPSIDIWVSDGYLRDTMYDVTHAN